MPIPRWLHRLLPYRSPMTDIEEFHKKFGLAPHPTPGGPLPADLMEFRIKFLREEIKEFERAAADDQDIAEMADALVVLVYVAVGTAYLLGLPWDRLWSEVHQANMQKIRVARPEHSKRGSGYDVVKPPGWEPPAIDALLVEHGIERAWRRLAR